MGEPGEGTGERHCHIVSDSCLGVSVNGVGESAVKHRRVTLYLDKVLGVLGGAMNDAFVSL